MAFQKEHKIGNRFSKGNQPRNPGRKKSRISELGISLEEEGCNLSREDIYKLLNFLLSCNRSEIEKLSRDPLVPIFIITLIRGISKDMEMGKADIIFKLYDRVYGKSMQPMEISGTKGIPLIPDKPMSRKAYEKLLIKLQCGG